MRQLALATTLLLSNVAAAEPCAVTIARAPEDVRAAIERWVAQERSCSSKLEVRVVPSDGGFYIIARDDRGRLHERVVPTAESAGVLVASWIADDSSGPPGGSNDSNDSNGSNGSDDPGLDGAAMAPVTSAPVTSAPGSVPVSPVAEEDDRRAGAAGDGAPVDTLPPSAADAIAMRRWFVVGPLLGMSDGGGFGVRVELDLKRHRALSFGAAIAASQSNISTMTGVFETLDTKVMAYVHHVRVRGVWELRGCFGAGITYTQASQVDSSEVADGIGPTFEMSARVTRSFGDWAIGVGPLMTFYGQRFRDVDQSALRLLELAGFVALHHRM